MENIITAAKEVLHTCTPNTVAWARDYDENLDFWEARKTAMFHLETALGIPIHNYYDAVDTACSILNVE